MYNPESLEWANHGMEVGEGQHNRRFRRSAASSKLSRARKSKKTASAELKGSGKADTHMNGTNFDAIDVETANADRSTICQIGIVHVRDGQIRDRWVSLVDPEDWFDDWNVDIHGISEETVRGAPTLPELHGELRDRLGASVVVSHTSFDRVAIERAMEKYRLGSTSVNVAG